MTRAVLSHRLRAHRKFIHDTVNVNGQPTAVNMVGNVVKLLKDGGVHHAYDKIKAAVAVWDDGKQRGLALPE